MNQVFIPSSPNVNAYDQGAAQQPIPYDVVQVTIRGTGYAGALVKRSARTGYGWCVVSREDPSIFEVYACKAESAYPAAGVVYVSLTETPAYSTTKRDEALKLALEAGSF